jgi:hypothetical protein
VVKPNYLQVNVTTFSVNAKRFVLTDNNKTSKMRMVIDIYSVVIL